MNQSIKVVNDITNFFSYNSIVILSFFLLSLLFLILNKLTNNKINNFFKLQNSFILNPLLYIRMFTSTLCHADWNHFKNNFLIILLIGPMLEEKYGSINLLIMMAITAVIIAILHLIFSGNPSLGASGITFMFITLSSIVNITDGKLPLTLILIFLFYIIDEIIKGIKGKDNIGHDAHFIGAVCGAIFGIWIF